MMNWNRGTVYISYTLTDYRRANDIGRVLKQQGYDVLMTPYDKTAFGSVVASDHLIRQADRVVCICSPTALRSKQVWQDMAMTRVWEKPVIPVLVKEFAYHTPINKYIDATSDPRLAVQQLLRALKRARPYKSNQLDEERSVPMVFKFAVRFAAVVAILSATMLLSSGMI